MKRNAMRITAFFLACMLMSYITQAAYASPAPGTTPKPVPTLTKPKPKPDDSDIGIYLTFGEDLPEAAVLSAFAGYRFGNDAVPSVQSVVGDRHCLDIAMDEYADGMGAYIEMTCESRDPLDDMIFYAAYLLGEGYDMYGGDAEFIDNSEGFLSIASADPGMLIYIELTWNEEQFNIVVSKLVYGESPSLTGVEISEGDVEIFEGGGLPVLFFSVELTFAGEPYIEDFPLEVTVYQSLPGDTGPYAELPGYMFFGYPAPTEDGGSVLNGFFTYTLESAGDIIIRAAEADGGWAHEWHITPADVEGAEEACPYLFEDDANVFAPFVFMESRDYDGDVSLANLRAYNLGSDLIYTMPWIIGSREITDWQYHMYKNGGFYLDIYYKCDDAASDIREYIEFLTDINGLTLLSDDSGSARLEMVSDNAGMLVYIDLEWDEDGCVVGISKYYGTKPDTIVTAD